VLTHKAVRNPRPLGQGRFKCIVRVHDAVRKPPALAVGRFTGLEVDVGLIERPYVHLSTFH